MAKYAKYADLGAYMGAPNMVKWGVPEKILQMQFSIRRAGLRSIGPSSQKLGRIKSRLPGRTLPAWNSTLTDSFLDFLIDRQKPGCQTVMEQADCPY